jgi:hypothetical protein
LGSRAAMSFAQATYGSLLSGSNIFAVFSM